MNTLAKALLTTAALGALLLAVPGPAASQSPATTAPIKFGMEASSVSMQTAAGVKPDYGTFWIGPWTLSSGWGGPDARLSEMKSAGVTPAIHFYYWGDDISPSCVENGCWSNLHNAQKDRAGWEKLGTQLTDHLNAKMGGAPVVIFLESEFNKGGIQSYEPFDGYMAAMADKIHAAYPNAIVVLGFGNWGSNYWGNFDRAAAASDMVGIQGMRGSTKQSIDGMKDLYEGLVAGVKTLGAKFPGKAIILTDIAVSSYPEPGYLAVQRDVLKEVLDNRATLKSLGVQAIIYRSWKDSPNMDTANYYGQAERHWGVAWAGNGTLKPVGHEWVKAVKDERASASAPSAATTTTTAANRAPVAAFSSSVSQLTASFDGSASSDPEGKPLTYAWTFGDGASATGRTVSHVYGSPGTYTATLRVSDGSLTGTASKAVSIVQANRAPTAAFAATARELAVTVDGSASSDPDGNALGYSWSFGDGSSATGRTASKTYAAAGTYTVKLTVSDGWLSSVATKSVTVAQAATSSSSATSAPPASGSGYSASFTFGGGANEWWMETKVSASPAPAKVEVKVGSGDWTPLRKRDSTTWGEEMHVKKGTPVAFRATASDGRTATTGQYAYLGGSGPMPATGAAPSPTTTSTAPSSTSNAAAPTTSASATSFKAYFTPRSVGNDWWVEVAAQGNEPLSKVEAKVDNGSWVTLSKTSWGTYAKSVHAPNGSQVTFRATGAATGGLSYSQPVTWT